MEELLRLLSDALGTASSGGMDTTSVAIHDLEAMETRKAAVREVASTRARSGPRPTNGGQPTPALASGAQSRPFLPAAHPFPPFAWAPPPVPFPCATLC